MHICEAAAFPAVGQVQYGLLLVIVAIVVPGGQKSAAVIVKLYS